MDFTASRATLPCGPRRGESMMHITSLHEDLRRCAAQGELQGALPVQVAGSLGDRDLIRFGRSLSLDVHQTLALVLKGQWEIFAHAGEAQEAGRAAEAPRGRRGVRRRKTYCSREFHAGAGQTADAAGLFELFEGEEHYATRSGYDREAFEGLVHHCVLLGLHLVSIHGPEMAALIASQGAERALLRVASSAEREEYWLKHTQWRELEAEVGVLLLDVETQALENERVQQLWMETFGAAYLPLLEAESRYGSLERQLRRKAENPALTVEELQRLEIEDRREQDREIARLRRHLARARVGDFGGPGGQPMNEAELWGYEEECKKLLREIYRLTHPDAVGQHGFTAAQREFLTACYRDAVACGTASAIDDEEVALGMRSLESLEAILGKARKVWQSMGLAWNEEAAIRGETLTERVAWLEARIAELEEEARDVKAELFAVATDTDVREKRASMASQDVVARVTAEMEARRASLDDQTSELESRLQELFQPRGPP